MPIPRVYVETTIPSFYYETRAAAELVAMRRITRHWWVRHRPSFQLCTSDAVIAELSQAPEPKRSQVLNLMRGVERLQIPEEAIAVAEAYIAQTVMPREAGGDALHLALASIHKIEFLLTWNCRHLANANKFRHIAQLNTRMGLFVPILTTPQALLAEEQP
jgi:hypothetical protein